ncbi:MAG: hypothetical protein PHV68_06600 [Candidatus Gastranaerophilales bacterium]|nr:hypothetical protein [Candidatus Gastranaerophilales bacterium]
MHAQDFHHFLEYIFHSNIINFLIVLAFIIWLVKKFNIIGQIDKKRVQIENEILSSKEKQKQSEVILEQSQKNVEDIGIKTDEILKNSKELVSNLVEKVHNETETQVKSIENRTSLNIETEKKRANEDVSKIVSKAAFIVASEHITKAIDDEMHEKFIDNFIENIENMKV